MRLVGASYAEPVGDAVGAPGRMAFTFEAVGAGTADIEFWYVRSFDDPPEPADRAEFEVRVGNAISVSELLARSPEEPVHVTGMLFDDGNGVRLCGVLAESFPPQCIGDAVVIANPGSIEAAFTSRADVRWTDSPHVLLGELVDGQFEIRADGPPPS